MSFVVPSSYAYTLLVASSTGLLLTWQQFLCGSARKAAKVDYPHQVPTAEQYTTESGAKFMRMQRAHGNTLESLPYFLFALLFSGVRFPILGASFGAIWVINRVIYTIGYSMSAKQRMYGVAGHIGYMGLMVTSIISAIALLP